MATKSTKRDEIRIADPDKKLYELIKRLADREKRTIGKQAEYMLIRYVEQNKLDPSKPAHK